MGSEIESGGKPCRAHERALERLHGGPVAGIDEAGRGPWAGPVVAAAVILDPRHMPDGLDDSKKLSESRRVAMFAEINRVAHIGVGIAEVDRIDRINILRATLWAMKQACKALPVVPAAALIDGNRPPSLPCPAETLVGGDGLSASIAAASIIAKVTRDRIMCELAASYPEYHWNRNKGYGTRAHADALARYGITSHHRRSFRPIRQFLEHSPLRRTG